VTLKRLKLYAFLSSAFFVLVLEVSRHLLYPYLLSLPGRLLIDAVLIVVALFFFGAFFHVLDSMQAQLERQNRELLALHQAGLDIGAELALDAVLQKVVDQARQLIESRFGALAVYAESGQISAFITSGMSPEVRAAIGDPPTGKGLLGVALGPGEHLLVDEIGADPRAGGFPPGHPPIRSLLAVPIICKRPFRGNLYVSERQDGQPFNAEDRETLSRFAVQASVAIDNAHLHERVRELAASEERLRLAHEMHDGLAQVLAYVNTKAQAVQGYLRHGKTHEASDQLNQLAAAAREVYADVREGILGLRVSSAPGRSLPEAVRDYVDRWAAQSGVSAEVEIDRRLRLPASIELQVFRIVQEGLANVRKHARAERVAVACHAFDDRVRVTVEDDGVGFRPEALGRSEFPRFGLATMRERAESLGGRLQISSTPGTGTRVEAEVPLLVSRGA
jgi:signal transduction histidine kinase